MTNKRRQIRWTDQEERKRILEPYSWNRPGAEERLLADNASSSSSSSNLLADTACNVALGKNETNSHTHMLNLMLMMTLMMMVVMM